MRQQGGNFWLIYIILCIHNLNFAFFFPSVLLKLCGALWTVFTYLGHFLCPEWPDLQIWMDFHWKKLRSTNLDKFPTFEVGWVQSGQKPQHGNRTKLPFSGSDHFCCWPGSLAHVYDLLTVLHSLHTSLQVWSSNSEEEIDFVWLKPIVHYLTNTSVWMYQKCPKDVCQPQQTHSLLSIISFTVSPWIWWPQAHSIHWMLQLQKLSGDCILTTAQLFRVMGLTGTGKLPLRPWAYVSFQNVVNLLHHSWNDSLFSNSLVTNLLKLDMTLIL